MRMQPGISLLSGLIILGLRNSSKATLSQPHGFKLNNNRKAVTFVIILHIELVEKDPEICIHISFYVC